MIESKIREILVSYQKKRDKAESELELRRNDVYSQIPEFKKIDEEISKAGLQLAKLVLQNPSNKEDIILESKKKMDDLRKRKEDLLIRYKVPTGYLEIQYECNAPYGSVYRKQKEMTMPTSKYLFLLWSVYRN